MLKEVSDSQTVVYKEQLKILIADNKDKDRDLKAMYEGCMALLSLLGLAESGKLKPECFGQDANPLPEVLKSAGSIMVLATQSQAPFGMGAKAEKKLLDKFAFFTDLIPLFQKYGNIYNP